MGYQDETLSSDEQYEEFLWEQAQEEDDLDMQDLGLEDIAFYAHLDADGSF